MTRTRKFYDISIPIRVGMPVYEGDPSVEILLTSSIKRGNAANVSRLCIGSHTGTHLDAPRHFVVDGRTVDDIPPETLMGPVTVVEMSTTGGIRRDDLISANVKGQERVLLKTTNSDLWQSGRFEKNFVYLTEDAAKYLVEIGLKLIGIDYLSVEKFGEDEPIVHRCLLKAEVVILEGLNLSAIRPGRYELACLPLRLKGGDGSPCRAILMEIQGERKG